jgi:hypothetical protein
MSEQLLKVCESCQKQFPVQRRRFEKAKFCSKACVGKGKRTPQGVEVDGHWFSLRKDGYFRWVSQNSNIYLHRYIWSKAQGEIPEGFDVHHINEDRGDNRLENLGLVSKAEHGRLHSNERWMRRGEEPAKPEKRCLIEGCIRPMHNRDTLMCQMHYYSDYRARKRKAAAVLACVEGLSPDDVFSRGMDKKKQLDDIFDKARVGDVKIAKCLGWTNIKAKKVKRAPHLHDDFVWIVTGVPPEAPYEERKLPCYHTKLEDAHNLADMFGLEAVKRKSGWIVRPKSALAANPHLDSGSAEGAFNGASAICQAVFSQLKAALL